MKEEIITPVSAGRKFLSLALRLFRFAGQWWLTEASRLCIACGMGWLIGQARRYLWITDIESNGEPGFQITTGRGEILLLGSAAYEDPLKIMSRQLNQAGYDINALPIGILIPPEAIFERNIVLPVAAIANFQKIAIEELCRRTPFKPETAFINMTILPHGADRSKRWMRQRIVRRDLVEQQCARLRIDITNVKFVTCASAIRQEDLIELTPAEPDNNKKWQRVVLALMTGVAMLAVLDFGLVYWQRTQAIGLMDAKIAAIQQKAHSVRGLLNQLNERQKLLGILYTHKSSPGTLQIWEEISRTLPDTSWLTEFQLGGDSLSITGYADNAAALIPLFRGSEYLTEIKLSSPIVVQGDGAADRFSISARLIRERQPRRANR
jgi:general secretion pathway protein L